MTRSRKKPAAEPAPKLDPKEERILKLERLLHEKQIEVGQLLQDRRLRLSSETVFDAFRQELKSHIIPFSKVSRKTRALKPSSIEEHCVMHVSDEHADQIVLPEQVGGLEDYNLKIALRRAENYVDKVIRFTQETLANYHFSTLWVICNGDHVNGTIHDSNEHSHLRNMFANTIAVGQMHAFMLQELSHYFEKVNVICMSGNHGRQTPKKDYNRPLNSLDYLVHEVAAAHCNELDNVEFLIPDAHSVNVEINGFNFNISHGDDVRGWNGIPWYGIERRNRKLQAIHAAQNTIIHYKVIGHFHTASSVSESIGETLVNGSWKATDSYLYNSFGGYTEPCQWLHGVHKNHGITWRMKIQLKSEDEAAGPTRYFPILACDGFNEKLRF